MDEDTEEYEDHGDGKSSISADLIRGHINTIILRSLYERDMYGYEIMNDINKKSHGQYSLKQPTLYSALKRLETQGYIQAYWKTDEVSSGGRRKYFRLTESGKEVAEKNIAEWEYSRTVIDSLISDENFDFSQPAPTRVDFKLLRQSTSRVYTGSGGNEIYEEDDETSENQIQPVMQEPIIEAVTFTSTHESSVVLEPEDIISDEIQQEDDVLSEENKSENQDDSEVIIEQSQAEQPETVESEEIVEENLTEAENNSTEADIPENEAEISENDDNQQEKQIAQQTASVQQLTAEPEQSTQSDNPAEEQQNEATQQHANEYDAERAAELAAAEDQRRISHEIYEKLIAGEFDRKSQPEPEPEPEPEPIPEPVASPPLQENIPEETQYNIYATRPEAERDYRNLVDKIFEQTVRQPATPQPAYQQTPPPQPQQQQTFQQQQTYQQPSVQVFEQPIQQYRQSPTYSEFGNKAAEDGLKIQTTSDSNNSEKAKRTTYNRGATLFTCSLIVGGIILLEFILCLIFKDKLAISFAYPFVILALGIVDIIVCGTLFGAGYGKQVRKPTSLGYIFTSIIITVLIMLIIVIFAVIFDDWSTAAVLKNVVIPCIVALNIPIFTLSFYILTK